jgi:hypothetical protein
MEPIQHMTMLIKQKPEQENKDYFSQLPNTVRKLIFMPFIRTSKNFKNTNHILTTMSLISKKSYEQTNCIFFTTDVINALAEKHTLKNSIVAHKLCTKGADYYITLGESIHEILNEKPYAIFCHKKYINPLYTQRINRLRSCLNQGADSNYHCLHFGVSPLTKALKNDDQEVVRFLLTKNAHN